MFNSLPSSVAELISTQITPAAPPPTYARPFAMLGEPSRCTSFPGTGSAQSKLPPSMGKQYRTAPSVWCMPSPKTILPSITAGELTVGSLMRGAPLVHVGLIDFGSLGSIGKLLTTPLLNAPNAGNKMSVPVGTGEAAKCSADFSDQSTSGLAGPAMLSVLPVRRLLPR